MANCLLMVENARPRKGILISINNMDKGMSVSSVVMSEIPVTPPSIKELGSKKPFNPKLADTTASMINKASVK